MIFSTNFILKNKVFIIDNYLPQIVKILFQITEIKKLI
jgi:hypothetical protein